MKNRQSTKNKPFVMPTADILLLEQGDIITTSGGFAGDWDENMPTGVDLSEIG